MFFFTPYITNESLLEAKRSNFGVQVSIKNAPKNVTTIIDFHQFFAYFSLPGALVMIVDMDAGWVGSESEHAEKTQVSQDVLA